ncbi:TraR/DksA C4-type zinc finger protein [Candidatus Parcubacteria bacterium]|nr:TraR/DksA C4-type zinc finger protein [Candidatus Parcubacteria bacterium]
MAKEQKIFHIDKKVLEEIKKSLEARRDKIKAELDKFTKEDKHEHEKHKAIFPEFGDKNDENAIEIATFTDNISIGKSLEYILRDIEDALQRIEKGTYGICKYCHQPILQERLKIRPVSSACIKCKKKIKGES